MSYDSYDKRSRVGKYDSPSRAINPQSVYLGEQPNSVGFTDQPNSFGLTEQATSFALAEQSFSFALGEQSSSFALSEQAMSFALSEQALSFGLGEQPMSFGLGEQPYSLSLSEQATSFNLSEQAFSFSLGEQASSFALSETPFSFGLTEQGSSFGLSEQPTSFGLSEQPMSFGLSEQNTSLGLFEQSSSFAIGEQATSFALGEQSSSFTLSEQPLSFGIGEQPLSFGLTEQALSIGLFEQAQSFGLGEQSSSFSLSEQPLSFGISEQALSFTLMEEARSFALSEQATSFGLGEQSSSFALTEQSLSLGLFEQPASFGLSEQALSIGLIEQPTSFGLTEQALSFALTEDAFSLGIGEQATSITLLEQAVSVRLDEQPSSFQLAEQSLSVGLSEQSSSFAIGEQPLSITLIEQGTSVTLGDQSLSIVLGEQSTSIGLSEQAQSFALQEQSTSLFIGEQPLSIGLGEQASSFSLSEQSLSVALGEQATSIGLFEQSQSLGLFEQPLSIGLGETASSLTLFEQPTSFAIGEQAVSVALFEQASSFGLSEQPTSFGLGEQSSSVGLFEQAQSLGLFEQATSLAIGEQPTSIGFMEQSSSVALGEQPLSYALSETATSVGLGEQSTSVALGEQANSIMLVEQGSSIALGEQASSFGLTEQVASVSLGEQPTSIGLGEQATSISLNEQPSSISISSDSASIVLNISYETYDIFTSQRLGWNSVYVTEAPGIREAICASSATNIGAIACTNKIYTELITEQDLGSLNEYSGLLTDVYFGGIPVSFMLYGHNGTPWGNVFSILPSYENLNTFINSSGKLEDPIVWKNFTNLLLHYELPNKGDINFVCSPVFHNVRSIFNSEFYHLKSMLPNFSYNFFNTATKGVGIPCSFMTDPFFIPLLSEIDQDYEIDYYSNETILDNEFLSSYVKVYYRHPSYYMFRGFENHALGINVSYDLEYPLFHTEESYDTPVIISKKIFKLSEAAIVNPAIKEVDDYLYFGYPVDLLIADTDYDDGKYRFSLTTRTVSPPVPTNRVYRNSNIYDKNDVYSNASVGLARTHLSDLRFDDNGTWDPCDKSKKAILHQTRYKPVSSDFVSKLSLSLHHSLMFMECESGYVPVFEDNSTGSPVHIIPINSVYDYTNDLATHIRGDIINAMVHVSLLDRYVIEIISDYNATIERHLIEVTKLSGYSGYGYIADLVSNYFVMYISRIEGSKIMRSNFAMPTTWELNASTRKRLRKDSPVSEVKGAKSVNSRLIIGNSLARSLMDMHFTVEHSSLYPISIPDSDFNSRADLLFTENEGHTIRSFDIPLVHPSMSPTMTFCEGAEIRYARGMIHMLSNTRQSLARHYARWIDTSDTPEFQFNEYYAPTPHVIHVFPSYLVTENGNWEAMPPEAERVFGYDPSISDVVVADKYLVDFNKSLTVHNNQLFLSSKIGGMTPNLSSMVLQHVGDYYLLNNYVICSSNGVSHVYFLDQQTGIKKLGSISGDLCTNPISTLGGSIIPVMDDGVLHLYGIQEQGMQVIFKKEILNFREAYSHHANDGSSVLTIYYNIGETNFYELHITIDNQMGLSLNTRTAQEGNIYTLIEDQGTSRLFVQEAGNNFKYIREYTDFTYTYLRSHEFRPLHREGMEYHTKSIVLYFDNTEPNDKVIVALRAGENQWISAERSCETRVVIHLPDRVIDALEYQLLLFNNDGEPLDENAPEGQGIIQIGGQTLLNLTGSVTSVKRVKSLLTRIELVGYYNYTKLGGNDA